MSKPQKPCSYPGCPALSDSGRCEKHRRQEKERYDATRGNSGERGYDAVWQRARRRKLNQDPLCEACEAKGLVVRAVLVHHIKPIAEGGERLAMSNLMSLCTACHEEIHGPHRWRK